MPHTFSSPIYLKIQFFLMALSVSCVDESPPSSIDTEQNHQEHTKTATVPLQNFRPYRHPISGVGDASRSAFQRGDLATIDRISSNERGERVVYSGLMQTNKTSAPSNLVPLANAPTSTRPKVDPALEQALSISNSSDAIVFFAEPDGVENYSTWLGAILSIRQGTAQDDILFLRETFLSERQSLFQNRAFSIIEQTDACGMDVFYLCSGMPCFLARISHDCLYTLDEHSLVQKIDASKDGSIEADGLEIEKGTQLSQFVDNDYEGYVYSGSERLHGAVIEPSKATDPNQGPPRDTHFGFRSFSSSWSRVTETEYCSNNGCTRSPRSDALNLV